MLGQARERGVTVENLARYCAEEPRGLVIGYGRIPRHKIGTILVFAPPSGDPVMCNYKEHRLFPAAVIALPIPAWDRITPAAELTTPA